MSWSYVANYLAISKKDQVRFKIGDTVAADGLLQDEEIEFLLSQNDGDVLRTAISCCISIISVLSGFTDFKVGPYSESQGSRLTAYQTLHRMLLDEATKINSPIAEVPTTSQIFYYNMMSAGDTDD